jgi:hypothetical protein
VASAKFYTYAHSRASDGRIFYIGKGCGSRAHSISGRSEYWNRITKKHGLQVQILAWWEKESDAFEHEKLLIASFRDMGYELCNRTDGGDGTSGLVRSEEWKKRAAEWLRKANTGKKDPDHVRKKKSESAKGRPMSPEAIAKTVAFHTGRKRGPETLAKMSAALKGKGLGKIVSQETRDKMSVLLTGKKRSEESKQLMREKRIKYWQDRKAKIEAARDNPEELAKLKIKPISEETKKKMSAAKKAYWERKRIAEQGKQE